jgi:hypothetical protein
MIPLDRLLAVRGVWERKALGLFSDVFREERREVEEIGRRGIREDRWLEALMAVWVGAGDEWGEIVAGVVESEKALKEGIRDLNWQRLVELITFKSTAIVDTTLEAFAVEGIAVYEGAAVRAGGLAATEAVQAMNFSQWETVKNRAPAHLKIWQSIIDDRTRQTHLDANGQVRKLNEPYEVGGALLQWPADAGGPLSETINCRCWEDYQLPG